MSAVSLHRHHQDFDAKAATWDADPRRRRLSMAIGRAMRQALHPSPAHSVLDYGSGTGLIALQFQARVRQVTAADTSAGMLRVLGGKLRRSGIRNVLRRRWNAETDPLLPDRYDLILSSMTFHHLGRLSRVLRAFHRLLAPGGKIAVADLESEDGSFHADPTGVRHRGFSRSSLRRRFFAAGFRRVQVRTAYRLWRSDPSGHRRAYPIFLLTAEK